MKLVEKTGPASCARELASRAGAEPVIVRKPQEGPLRRVLQACDKLPSRRRRGWTLRQDDDKRRAAEFAVRSGRAVGSLAVAFVPAVNTTPFKC